MRGFKKYKVRSHVHGANVNVTCYSHCAGRVCPFVSWGDNNSRTMQPQNNHLRNKVVVLTKTSRYKDQVLLWYVTSNTSLFYRHEKTIL